MGRARHRAPLCSLLLPTVARAAESAGDLSSVVSAIGDTYDWPEEFAALKERLRPDAQLLREAWQRLDRALDVELAEIARRRQDVIPVVDFSSIQQNGGRIPSELEADVRKRGVVIVRGVVDSDQARGWKTAVQRYARDNPSHVGFPKDNPQVLELYWSKPQLEARQHANMHATMLAVNRLWSGGKDHVSFEHAFSYGERLRIRQPGKGFSLHPHTDGGSIERFEDPHYQSVYRHVWEGRWEEYDPWAQADERALANVSMYAGKADTHPGPLGGCGPTPAPRRARAEGPRLLETPLLPGMQAPRDVLAPRAPEANGYCTTFRAFQGWMSISSIGAGPDAGTLKVLPLLKEATARIMMRPFLDDVPAADFCGAIPGMSHDVTPKWHGKLHAGLVPLPAMAPGDTVWWHADLVHAVEALHNGTEDSSVLYIPSFPATARNAAYVAQQRERFREGRTPPDFPPNDSEMDFSGRGTEQDLTAVGRSMLGFEPLSRGGDDAVCSAGGGACVEGAAGGGATSLLAECDRTLGFSALA